MRSKALPRWKWGEIRLLKAVQKVIILKVNPIIIVQERYGSRKMIVHMNIPFSYLMFDMQFIYL